MQLAGAEIDIVPAQGDRLAGAQPVAIGEQDSRCVPMTPTVAAGGVHKLLDLALRWRIQRGLHIIHENPPKRESTVTNQKRIVTISREGKTTAFRFVLPDCHNRSAPPFDRNGEERALRRRSSQPKRLPMPPSRGEFDGCDMTRHGFERTNCTTP